MTIRLCLRCVRRRSTAAGNDWGRIEEEKNPDTGLHLLVVVNEPDVWKGMTAKLYVDGKDIPTRVEVTGPDLDLAIVYHAFEELRDAPADLFTKPAGVKFVEQQR